MVLRAITRKNPGTAPTEPGSSRPALAPCPARPNCVCSDAADEPHRVHPYTLKAKPAAAWQALKNALLELPRTRVVLDTGDYLHAECKSAIFRFIDDLEFQLRPGQGVIAVRSASRLGYSDLGVNRRRIEKLRSTLRARGILR